MRSVKREIRIVGFDDGPFIPRTKGRVPVVGVVFRGGDYLDGAFKTEVSIDGMDATKILIKLLNKSRHKKQLRIIMLKGITFGGFNMVDISSLYDKTGLPVIVVNRRKKRGSRKGYKVELHKKFDTGTVEGCAFDRFRFDKR